MKNHKISDIKNYKATLREDKIRVYSAKYIELIQEFLGAVVQTIEIENEEYYKYIVQKGIDTIKHIFDILFLYTKNLDLTIKNCEEVFIYYTSIYPQIGEREKQFIQFNSKQAIFCQYQKTICEINKEYRKDFKLNQKDHEIIKTIKSIQNNFDELLRIIIKRDGKYLQEKNDYFFDTLITLILQIMNNLIKYEDQKNPNLKKIQNTLENQLFLIKHLSGADISCIHYLNIILYISKKIYKKKLNMVEIKAKINDIEKYESMLKCSPLKFANWIYADKKNKNKKTKNIIDNNKI